MFNPLEFTKSLEDFFKNDAGNLSNATEKYKEFSEKASQIFTESLNKHSDLTQKWSEESLKNFESFTKDFSTENVKASSEFMMAQTKLAPRYLEEFSENAKKMQVEFTELLMDSTNSKDSPKPSSKGK